MSHDLSPKKSIIAYNDGLEENQNNEKEEIVIVKQSVPDTLPILEGQHSLGPDMKFGWKPEVDFESAPIPLYFNFVEHPLQSWYEEQAYYQNTNNVASNFKIIYYGPRFKDSFEMHKNFVKPAENTYDFQFPKLGFANAKAFYDSVFEDMMDGEAPRRDEMREFQGMSPDIEYNELIFNSNFENGNLDMVVKTAENSYDLFLRVDTNTRGHFAWFHFEVSRTRKNKTVHFSIVNMSKKESMFNHGMQVNYWSQKKNMPNFCGWQKGGTNIRYGKRIQGNTQGEDRKSKQRKYYCLSFDFTFEHDNDKIWFAFTIPYSYSMLVQYLKSINMEQRNWIEYEKMKQSEYEQEIENGNNRARAPRKRGRIFQDAVLCKSLGGVEVPIVTITNFEDKHWQKEKKVVFVQSRIHPGETASSWIVHGLISFLISKSRVAELLRKRLVFKIIPMLNPDGVIIGNTRTTLLGTDMNRQYADQEDQDHRLNPIPHAIKELISSIVKEDKDKIMAFWDLHQHSKKKSIFAYGPYYPLHSDKYLIIRIMPKLLSERSEMFRFFSCRFRIDKYKENCARITVGKMFNIVNCFTLECSAYGFIRAKDRSTQQFKEEDLIEFGKSFAECILEYCLILEKDKKTKEQIKQRMAEKKKNRKPVVPPKEKKEEEKKTQKRQAESGDESNYESDENSSHEESEEEDDDNDEFQSKKIVVVQKQSQNSSPQRQDEDGELEQLEDDDDDDHFYSDEEEEENDSSSPVQRPNDLKSLLKHKQKKSRFDIKAYTDDDKKSRRSKQKIKTLDQILSMIQNDIIHEESENDSNPSIGDDDSSEGADEDQSDSSNEDNLDEQDQKILKERILHAIQVFSRWSPNPKKEIMKQKRMNKLSIENRSKASSKKSNRSDSKKSLGFGEQSNEIILPFNKDQQKSMPHSPGSQQRFNKRKKMGHKNQKEHEFIDNFLKEFGLLQNKDNKLLKAGTFIENIDDEVLSTISNEIIKQKKLNKKKGKKQQPKSSLQGDLLMVKSFGTNKNQVATNKLSAFAQNNQEPKQAQFSIGLQKDNDFQQVFNKNGNVVVGSARKVILQKFLAMNNSQTNINQSVINQQSDTTEGFTPLHHNQQIRPIKVHAQPSKQPSDKFSTQAVSLSDYYPPQAIQPQLIQFNDIQPANNKEKERSSQKKEMNKVRFQVDEEIPKNSHLLGYESKIAMLNQAILQKKQKINHSKQQQPNYLAEQKRPQSSIHHSRYHSAQFTVQNLMQNSSQAQINYKFNPQQNLQQKGIVKVPNLVQQKGMNPQLYLQQQNSIHSVQGHMNVPSYDGITPPFFSCQIHPQPNANARTQQNQQKRRNLSTYNYRPNQSNKVNAATDTINPLDLLQEPSQHHYKEENHQTNRTNRHQESAEEIGEFQLSQETMIETKAEIFSKIASHENTGLRNSQTLTEISVPNIHSNVYGQHLNHSTFQQALQMINETKPQKPLPLHLQPKQTYQHKPLTRPEDNSSLQEYLESQQISLHQWMQLSQNGFLQKMPNNQLIVGAKQALTTKKAVSPSVDIQTNFSKPNQSHDPSLIKLQPNYTEQPRQPLPPNFKQNVITEIKQVSKPISRSNERQPMRPNQNIVKGRAQSVMYNKEESQSSLLIKNEYKPQKTRFKMFANPQQASFMNNSLIDFIEKNKSQIVRDIILNSGTKILTKEIEIKQQTEQSKMIEINDPGTMNMAPKIKLNLKLARTGDVSPTNQQNQTHMQPVLKDSIEQQ